jgi:hypothetical protein
MASKLKQVEQYIQEWNLTKLVSDEQIARWVRAWRGEFDARELVKGLIEYEYLAQPK